MSALNEVKDIAVDIFDSVLKASADSGGIFRVLITAKIEGKEKPLLIVGNANSSFEDGSCIAVLNPDKDVLQRIQGGVYYHNDILKKTVQGKCDLMVELWIDAYIKKDGVCMTTKYQACESREVTFEIR
jgi:hypothetical protein